MGKFRSKLKRHTKGKNWSKGHSSTSNPEQMKHRLKAKSRFFQPNLSLGKYTKKNNVCGFRGTFSPLTFSTSGRGEKSKFLNPGGRVEARTTPGL